MSDTARVILWGSDIGAVTWVPERALAVFQYTPDFAASGIEVAPLTMPLRDAPYQFPTLARATFKGLPGLLADSLPDKFGNSLIDAWLATQGRQSGSFTPVERLCYTGSRGMGALEFKPAYGSLPSRAHQVDIDALVDLANRVLDDRITLAGKLNGDNDQQAIEDILRVGTSAGGARAKAVLSWNRQTGEFRSGQVPAEAGFSQWILKFDGVARNRDRELNDPLGFGRIEYAYSLMAQAAGIEMHECRLHEENGRAHFMTLRFDRSESGDKLHMQSLGALMHLDFNQAGAHSYEQAILAMRRLNLPATAIEQQVRRAFFNIIARNQDDHVKNIAFLMDRRGHWQLSPAYDVTYSYNPSGNWTHQHQMSLNTKHDGFVIDDLITFAQTSDIKRSKAMALIKDVVAAIENFPSFAVQAGVDATEAARIASTFRTRL